MTKDKEQQKPTLSPSTGSPLQQEQAATLTPQPWDDVPPLNRSHIQPWENLPEWGNVPKPWEDLPEWPPLQPWGDPPDW